MIFVDTSAWYAVFVPSDHNHQVASQWLQSNSEQLVTSDFIFDELLTLLKFRREFQRAILIGESLISGSIAKVEWVTPIDLNNAWLLFREFRDKDWSFTDCTSRVLMERLKTKCAFAFDRHFSQFGTIQVVPSP